MRKLYQLLHSKNMVFLFLILLLIVPGNIEAKKKTVKSTPSSLRLKWYKHHEAMRESSHFKNLKWQFLGPKNVSGRMTDVAVVTPKGKNYAIYVAGASGGIWKTENEGITWDPIFEQAPSTAIGDIALAPSDQNIIYVGTGEANIFRSSQPGAGMFKSTDAGQTWEYIGLGDTLTIARIVVHPKNPDVVYVAASGHEWTDNEQRGGYKTIDGGKTWEKIKYVDQKTAAIDLVMDPSAPDTLYAAFWQRIRMKWDDPRNEEGYKGSGVFKTTDGGKTWQAINKGLPEARFRGRIGIDLCKAQPNVLYAFIDNYDLVGQWKEGDIDSYGRPRGNMIKGATLFRSDDGGAQWRQVSQENDYMRRLSSTYGWVFGQVRVDPNVPDRIYVMGLLLNVSDDSGKTFRPLRGMHVDHHGLWIDPDNSNYLVNVNDGGLAISYDRGKTFRTFYNNLPLVQFFNVMYDMDTPFRVYGSIQDHGSRRGIVDLSKGRNGIPAQDWEGAPGGEGSSHAIDPTNPNIVYSAGFYGSISRTDLNPRKRKNIVPKPPKGEPPYRGQWVAPFIISPHDSNTIYHGMNYLFYSKDRGDSWERISPDLTYNDKNKMGDIPYQTLFSISESPIKAGLLYVGTDDGRAWVTRDRGKKWLELKQGIPKGKWISRVQASAFDLGTVYMAQNGKRDDDFTPYLWKSVNFGKKWRSIAANIPLGPINVIREDPKNKNILYVGTDTGVYVTINGGKSWHVLGDLSTTYVHDLVIHPRDDVLVIATHGRGMFAMDVRPLQQLNSGLLAKPIHLFDVETARRPRRGWFGWAGGQKAFFQFYLKDAQQVKVVLKKGSDKVIKEWTVTANAGMNNVIWDLAKKPDTAAPETGRRANPYVTGGTYSVQLIAGTSTVAASFKVK